MIEIRNLVKKFDTVTASDNLHLDINQGVVGLVGHNGAGKSTLLRLISGVIYPTSGQILIDGFPASSKEAKQKIFFLPDNPYAPKNATVKDVLSLYGSMYEIDEDKFQSIINKLELPTNRKIRTYSKGMKRQLFLSIALSIKSEYLLLDEAFDGVDPVIMEIIKTEIISRAKEGETIILSSHNLSVLERLVDRFIILSKGRLANSMDEGDLGEEFVKFQILTSKSLNEELLKENNIEVASFKQIGSIYHVVLKENEEMIKVLEKLAKPQLFERIPIDPDEMVTMQMMLAKKEKK